DPDTLDGEGSGDGASSGQGATGEDGQDDDGQEGSPPTQEELDAIEVPQWRLGDRWNFSASEGRWSDYRVVGISQRGDIPTYQLAVRHGFGASYTSQSLWIDQETLGTVAVSEGGVEATFGCPIGRLLPATDDSWSCTYAGGTVEQARTVGSWATYQTDAGERRGIQLHFETDDGFRETQTFSWYAPSVGYRVAYVDDDGRTYTLRAWSWAAGP
ncbi:MAG: hypothetical protein ACPGQL_00445, partial [Thermoplasmatota archaeon]